MSSEKEPKSHYSYEEMVERLRENRPKGSRVKSEEREYDPETGKVTVRRQKKRRTGTGKSGLLKDPRWFRFLRRSVYIGVPVAGALLVVAYLVVAASVGTGRFQQGLGTSVATNLSLAKPAAINGTSLRGLSLKIQEATLAGASGALFSTADGRDIEMRLNPTSFLGGDWLVDYCDITNAQIRLAPPGATTNPAQSPAASDSPGTDPSSPSGGGFLLSGSPNSIIFNDVTLGQADILFGNGETASLPGLRGVRASLLRREPENGPAYYDSQITGGRDGTLSLPGWEPMRIENMRVEFRPEEATIKRSVLHYGTDEESKAKEGITSIIEAKGTIPLQGGNATVDIATRGLLLADLLPKGALRYLTGVFRADALRLGFDLSDPAATWRLQGPASLDIARLRGLKLFSLLQKITGGEITTLDFDECSFVLDMSPAGTRITEIKAVSLGRAHLTGQVAIAPKTGELVGKLRLGIARESLLEKYPDFFQPGEEAASWTDVEVGGVLSSPTEDLSPRIQVWLASQGREFADPATTPDSPDGGSFAPIPGGDAEPPPPARKDTAPQTEEGRLESLFNDLLEEPKP